MGSTIVVLHFDSPPNTRVPVWFSSDDETVPTVCTAALVGEENSNVSKAILCSPFYRFHVRLKGNFLCKIFFEERRGRFQSNV